MSKYGIQYGINKVIYVGKLNKAQTMFLDGKEDLTNESLVAVMRYLLENYPNGMEWGVNGKTYRMTATELDGK